MRTALQFGWNATRGYRLRPWKSPYLRWRLETLSGLEAERIGMWDFISFFWRERRGVARFLLWTGEMNGYRKQSLHPVQSSQAGPSDNDPANG